MNNRPDLGYHFFCYLNQPRHATPPLTPLDSALTRKVGFCTILVQISPLESALTDTPLLTPLESALTKIPGVGGTPTLSRLQRPASLIQPPEPSARASIPFGLTRLRILPVTTGVYPLQPKILSVLSVPLWQIHCFHTLAASFASPKKSIPLQSSKSSLFLAQSAGCEGSQKTRGVSALQSPASNLHIPNPHARCPMRPPLVPSYFAHLNRFSIPT